MQQDGGRRNVTWIRCCSCRKPPSRLPTYQWRAQSRPWRPRSTTFIPFCEYLFCRGVACHHYCFPQPLKRKASSSQPPAGHTNYSPSKSQHSAWPRPKTASEGVHPPQCNESCKLPLHLTAGEEVPPEPYMISRQNMISQDPSFKTRTVNPWSSVHNAPRTSCRYHSEVSHALKPASLNESSQQCPDP